MRKLTATKTDDGVVIKMTDGRGGMFYGTFRISDKFAEAFIAEIERLNALDSIPRADIFTVVGDAEWEAGKRPRPPVWDDGSEDSP